MLLLTSFDVLWLFTGHVECVFVYPYSHMAKHFTTHLSSYLVFTSPRRCTDSTRWLAASAHARMGMTDMR
jgi:hypothetical protein